MNRTLILFYIILLSVVKLEGKNAYLAPVCNDLDQWGYINEKGKIIVSFKYEFAFPFAYNKALALRKGKWILLDKISLKEEILDNYLQNYFSDMFVEVKEEMIFDPRMNYNTYKVLEDIINNIPYDCLIDDYNLVSFNKIPYWKNTFILLNPQCFLISLSKDLRWNDYHKYVFYNYKSHTLAYNDTVYNVELYNYNNIIIASEESFNDSCLDAMKKIVIPSIMIFSNNLEKLSLDSFKIDILECMVSNRNELSMRPRIFIGGKYFKDTFYLEIKSEYVCNSPNYFTIHNDNGSLKIQSVNRKFELVDIYDSLKIVSYSLWERYMQIWNTFNKIDSSLHTCMMPEISNNTHTIINLSKPIPVRKSVLSEEKIKENRKKGKFEYYLAYGVFNKGKVVCKPKYRYIGIFN